MKLQYQQGRIQGLKGGGIALIWIEMFRYHTFDKQTIQHFLTQPFVKDLQKIVFFVKSGKLYI